MSNSINYYVPSQCYIPLTKRKKEKKKRSFIQCKLSDGLPIKLSTKIRNKYDFKMCQNYYGQEHFGKIHYQEDSLGVEMEIRLHVNT